MKNNNKSLIIIIIAPILIVGAISLIFCFLSIVSKNNPSLYLDKIIRISNIEIWNDFFSSANYNKISIDILLKKEHLRINNIEDNNSENIQQLWTFIKNAREPYVKNSGSYDKQIYIKFYKNLDKIYGIDIYKNDDSELTYFFFYQYTETNDGNVIYKGVTNFSCYDKEGFVDKIVDRYYNKKE